MRVQHHNKNAKTNILQLDKMNSLAVFMVTYYGLTSMFLTSYHFHSFQSQMFLPMGDWCLYFSFDLMSLMLLCHFHPEFVFLCRILWNPRGVKLCSLMSSLCVHQSHNILICLWSLFLGKQTNHYFISTEYSQKCNLKEAIIQKLLYFSAFRPSRSCCCLMTEVEWVVLKKPSSLFSQKSTIQEAQLRFKSLFWEVIANSLFNSPRGFFSCLSYTQHGLH